MMGLALRTHLAFVGSCGIYYRLLCVTYGSFKFELDCGVWNVNFDLSEFFGGGRRIPS